MKPPAPKAPSKPVLALAARWADVARREKELRDEKAELGKELLPFVRPHGEVVLEDGSAVGIDSGSSKADATLTRLAAHFGAEKAKAFWKSLPENGYERLSLRAAPAPEKEPA